MHHRIVLIAALWLVLSAVAPAQSDPPMPPMPPFDPAGWQSGGDDDGGPESRGASPPPTRRRPSSSGRSSSSAREVEVGAEDSSATCSKSSRSRRTSDRRGAVGRQRVPRMRDDPQERAARAPDRRHGDGRRVHDRRRRPEAPAGLGEALPQGALERGLVSRVQGLLQLLLRPARLARRGRRPDPEPGRRRRRSSSATSRGRARGRRSSRPRSIARRRDRRARCSRTATSSTSGSRSRRRTPRDAGTTGWSSRSPGSASSGWAAAGSRTSGRPDKSVTVHEFGHSFVGLLDEYSVNPGKPFGPIAAPNASTTSDPRQGPVGALPEEARRRRRRLKGGATYIEGVWRPSRGLRDELGRPHQLLPRVPRGGDPPDLLLRRSRSTRSIRPTHAGGRGHRRGTTSSCR